MMLIGVTAALYAVELSLAIVAMDQLGKTQGICQQLTNLNDVLSGQLTGDSMRNIVSSLPGTGNWYWDLHYSYSVRSFSSGLENHLWDLHARLVGDAFTNIVLPSLALVALVAAMVHTWKTMGLISHMKM